MSWRRVPLAIVLSVFSVLVTVGLSTVSVLAAEPDTKLQVAYNADTPPDSSTNAGIQVAYNKSPETSSRKYRVAIVQWRGDSEIDRGVKDYLGQAGLNVEYKVFDAQQNKERFVNIIEEIRHLKPDVIYTVTTEATLGIVGKIDSPSRDHISDIPVVFAAVGDPIAAGLVDSLQHPTHNVTGVIHLPTVDVQYKTMRQYAPIRRLGVLYNEKETYGRSALEQIRKLAAKDNIDVVAETILNPAGEPDIKMIQPALSRLAAAKVDMLFLPSTSFFIPMAQKVTILAFQMGMPTFGGNEPMVRDGKAMFGLVTPFYVVGQFTGYKIYQLLEQHKKPQDIPIETLSRFSLVVNMDVARLVHLYPPLPMLRYAQIVGR